MSKARALVAAVCLAAAAVPRVVAAQSSVVDQSVDVGVAALALGRITFGQAAANLTAPGGGTLPLFQTKNTFPRTVGVEAELGFPLFWRLRAEAVGTYSQPSLRSDVSGDIEGVPDLRVSVPVTRYSVGAAVLWMFWSHGRADVFVRGGSSWMRELADSATLARDGTFGDLGVGVKYWWHGKAGPRGRLALRFDARATARSRAFTLGPDIVRVTPAVAAGLTYGF